MGGDSVGKSRDSLSKNQRFCSMFKILLFCVALCGWCQVDAQADRLRLRMVYDQKIEHIVFYQDGGECLLTRFLVKANTIYKISPTKLGLSDGVCEAKFKDLYYLSRYDVEQVAVFSPKPEDNKAFILRNLALPVDGSIIFNMDGEIFTTKGTLNPDLCFFELDTILWCLVNQNDGGNDWVFTRFFFWLKGESDRDYDRSKALLKTNLDKPIQRLLYDDRSNQILFPMDKDLHFRNLFNLFNLHADEIIPVPAEPFSIDRLIYGGKFNDIYYAIIADASLNSIDAVKLSHSIYFGNADNKFALPENVIKVDEVDSVLSASYDAKNLKQLYNEFAAKAVEMYNQSGSNVMLESERLIYKTECLSAQDGLKTSKAAIDYYGVYTTVAIVTVSLFTLVFLCVVCFLIMFTIFCVKERKKKRRRRHRRKHRKHSKSGAKPGEEKKDGSPADAKEKEKDVVDVELDQNKDGPVLPGMDAAPDEKDDAEDKDKEKEKGIGGYFAQQMRRLTKMDEDDEYEEPDAAGGVAGAGADGKTGNEDEAASQYFVAKDRFDANPAVPAAPAPGGAPPPAPIDPNAQPPPPPPQ